MPTFPPSPLSFRTAGFPQYGWKAGMSDSAFPEHQSLKPVPCIRRLTPALHLSFAQLIVGFGYPVLSRADHSSLRRLGVGLSLRFGCFCPGPSTLISPIRPTRGHIAISPSLRLLHDAFAVRERLGDPRVVPSFRCTFLPDMPSSMPPGRSETALSSSQIPT